MFFEWPGFSAPNRRIDGEGPLNLIDEVVSVSYVADEACASMSIS